VSRDLLEKLDLLVPKVYLGKESRFYTTASINKIIQLDSQEKEEIKDFL
jgi:hypothetical protein